MRPQSTVEGQAGETQASRANDANFSYAAVDTAEFQFDSTGDDNGVFSLGRDLNGDGMLTAAENELGVPFGFCERQLAIFTANGPNIRAGNVPVAEGEESTDRYRLRLRIDAGNIPKADNLIPGLPGNALQRTISRKPEARISRAFFAPVNMTGCRNAPRVGNDPKPQQYQPKG